jgi:hypothetical protein
MFRALRRPRALSAGVSQLAPGVSLTGGRLGNLGVALAPPRPRLTSTASSSLPAAASIFSPRIEYDPAYTTPRANPATHDFSDAGLYMSLGDDAAAAAAFPGGFAGDLDVEFKVAGANALLVRPVGVALVASLEHWRQTHGRALAGAGQRVLDVDASAPYVPAPLVLPQTRAAVVAAGGGGRGGAGAAGESAGAGGAGAAAAAGGASAGATAGAATGGAGVASAAAKGAGAGAGAAAGSAPARTAASGRPWDLRNGVHPHAIEFRPARVLVGPRGIGKSGVLNYVVHYARANGWISVFVPDAFAVANLGLVLAPSRLRPGCFDQHDCALAILRATMASSGELLARVPQRLPHAKHRYLPVALDAVVSAERAALRAAEEAEVARLKAVAEATGKPWDPASFSSAYENETDTAVDRTSFTLADLVTWGLRHPPALTDTLLALLAELRVTTEFPVLIAVDGVNHFYTQGPYEAAAGPIPPAALSTQAAFACFDAQGFRRSFSMKRGVWLSAVSMKHTADMEPMFSAVNIRDRFRVPVPPLTRQEVHSMLSHYKKSDSFFMLQRASDEARRARRAHAAHTATPHSRPPPFRARFADNAGIEPFDVEYYRALSGGNPSEVFRAAMFTPGLKKKHERKKASVKKP